MLFCDPMKELVPLVSLYKCVRNTDDYLFWWDALFTLTRSQPTLMKVYELVHCV
jgi:hypothetical protein